MAPKLATRPDPRAGRKPRQSYTMTAEQFAAMGGAAPPAGYDPDAAELLEFEQRGHVHLANYVNRTDRGGKLGPPPTLEQLQQLAAEHEVHMLTIHWPDRYFPEFTAVPK